MTHYRKLTPKPSLREQVSTNRRWLDMMADSVGHERMPVTQTEQALAARPARTRAVATADPREKDIQAAIFDYLRADSRVAIATRYNSGKMPWQKAPGERIHYISFYRMFLRAIGRVRDTGHADIGGMLVGGRAYYFEVKTQTGKLTEEQADFLECVRNGGGISAVVRSIEDVQRALGA